jgi:hypothetical protein
MICAALIALIATLGPRAVLAQTLTVSGRVIDDSGAVVSLKTTAFVRGVR